MEWPSLLSVIGPVLAATVGLALWFVRSVFERRQKRNDVLTGLHAEIIAGGYAARLLSENRAESLKNTTPFATADRTDFVFESIKSDISILPAEVIHAVVEYYRLAERSNLLTDDLRTQEFRDQPETERREFIFGLINVVSDQTKAARAALDSIEEYARRNLPWRITRGLLAKRRNDKLNRGVRANTTPSLVSEPSDQTGRSDRA